MSPRLTMSRSGWAMLAVSTGAVSLVVLATVLWVPAASHTARPLDLEAVGPHPLETLACSVQGLVTLERAQVAPDPCWVTSLRVDILPEGGDTPIETMPVSTDHEGVFFFYVTDPGVYDIGVKSAHSLENRKFSVEVVKGFNPDFDFGRLREGDANDNNQVEILDYSILYTVYDTPDARADFNQDGTTDILDYSLLYTNYGMAGPRPARLALLHRPTQGKPGPAAVRNVHVSIDSATVTVGDLFELLVRFRPAAAEVDGADMHLAFDPAVLRVVDRRGCDSDHIIARSALPNVIRNTANNATGLIRYAAGAAFGGPPVSSDSTIASIPLKAVAPADRTSITFHAALLCGRGIAHSVSPTSGIVQVMAVGPSPCSTASSAPMDATPVPPSSPTAPTRSDSEVITTASPRPVVLPLVMNRSSSDNRRFGVNAIGSIADYDVSSLPIGWYSNWTTAVAPPRPGGIEFVHTVRLRDDAESASADHWPPDWDAIDDAIAANPAASLWLVGNEPDVESQDNCTPQQYAARYHEVYNFIKARDPLARISAAGIVQPTPLRLEWLDMVLEAYEAAYGRPLPVDVWNVHVQILPERRGGWGCEIPPGIPDDVGEDHQVNDNARVRLFREKILLFRTWMRDRGYRERPLVISEYGVLMPSGYGYLGGTNKALGDQMVKDFMSGTFDYCLATTDPHMGYAPDGNRLVQRWAWYSLNAPMFDPSQGYCDDCYNGSLFEPGRAFPGVLTQFGEHFREYVRRLAT